MKTMRIAHLKLINQDKNNITSINKMHLQREIFNKRRRNNEYE
jgi:hypothetical protein